MKTIPGLIILFSLNCLPSVSQDTIRIYLNENYEVVDSAKCTILRKVLIDEKKVYHLWDSYLDGKKIVSATYKSINPWIEDGKFSYYNEEGKLIATGEYDNAYLTGKWIYYNLESTDTVDYSSSRKILGDLTFSWITQLQINNSRSEISTAQKKFIEEHLQYPVRAGERNFGTAVIHVSVKIGGKRELQLLSFSHPDYAYEACRFLLEAPDGFYLDNSQDHGKVSKNFEISFKRQNFTDSDTAQLLSADTSALYVFVDEQAAFMGGDINTFRDWVQSNLIYPPEAVKSGIFGRVTVQFAVNYKGEVFDIKILHGVHPSLDKETIRVINSSPKWVAARYNGRVVNQQFVIPVIFMLH
jgi:TonB family protein